MCGIAGALALSPGAVVDESLVAAMTDILAHRGPDDAGMLVDHPVVLGHRRLSIIDLSPAGHQPMRSHDGRLWITFNGEIYNYKELGRELRSCGHRFVSASDTEVLLAAYAQWGPGALQRLNGMFAFAVWDRERRELFLARDRFGVKPLYTRVVDETFYFASEIKGLLLVPDAPPRPDDELVMTFLAYGLTDHTPRTMFAGIEQVPPGSYVAARAGAGVQAPVRWYEPRGVQLAPEAGPGELRDRLADSVALRLRSDVPVGTTLSGGLDSSTISVLAAELRREHGLEPDPTFSSRCVDPRVDEGPFVDAVLARTGAPNHAVYPTEDDLFANLDRVLWHMDEPFHSAAVYAQWKLSAVTRESGVVVLLDGQGGDEALAGYDYMLYPGFFCSGLKRGSLRRVVHEARARRAVQGTSLERSLKELVRTCLPGRFRSQRPPSWLRTSDGVPLRQPLAERSLLGHHLHSLNVQPLPMYNHHADRNSMAVSLESRNPFLDYRVVELGLGLRPEQHVRDGFTKWTLRQAMRDLLPPEIIGRGRKQGFTTDEAEWMRGALGELMEETFESEAFRSRPWIDADGVLATLEAHRRGEDRAAEIWRPFILDRWLALFLDSGSAPGETTAGVSRVSARASVTRLDGMPDLDEP